MEKETVLISGCLIGLCCRYDGEQKRNKNIAALMEKYYLIPVCPEQLGLNLRGTLRKYEKDALFLPTEPTLPPNIAAARRKPLSLPYFSAAKRQF